MKKFGMDGSKLLCTFMVTGCKLGKYDDSPKADKRKYRSMIGWILYLIATRSDIMHVVCLVARFQEDPKETHVVVVVKRIFRYLNGTPDYGLWYPRDTEFTLSAYTNVDWTRCVDDKKEYKWWCILSWLLIGSMVE